MAFELREKICEFLAGFLSQFHRSRWTNSCHFFARTSVVVYAQYHDEETSVVLISLRGQWQEVTNGNSYR